MEFCIVYLKPFQNLLKKFKILDVENIFFVFKLKKNSKIFFKSLRFCLQISLQNFASKLVGKGYT